MSKKVCVFGMVVMCAFFRANDRLAVYPRRGRGELGPCVAAAPCADPPPLAPSHLLSLDVAV